MDSVRDRYWRFVVVSRAGVNPISIRSDGRSNAGCVGGFARPPSIREVSATGSGDVFFACVLQALFVRSLTLREAVAFALPYAAANAAHAGIAEFPKPGA